MVFDDPRLCGRNVHNIAGKWRGRFRGMECLLDVAQQFIDVFAGDAQPSLLSVVQCPRGIAFFPSLVRFRA